jgi:hypothetical protein
MSDLRSLPDSAAANCSLNPDAAKRRQTTKRGVANLASRNKASTLGIVAWETERPNERGRLAFSEFPRSHKQEGFMYLNLPKWPSDGSDGSVPSEARLFAQALLGKPIPRIVSPESKARADCEELERLAQFSTRHAQELHRLQATEAQALHDREVLEFAAQISTQAAGKLRANERKEVEEREAWRRAELFAESLLEDNWDPSKHPRLGGPPNAGWWVTTRGGAQGTETGGRRMIAATPAIHTTSKGIPAKFASAQSGGGHHWVPQAVFADLLPRIEPDALDFFKAGTRSTELYDHAFDTWNGVTHGEYSKAMHELLDDWIKKRGGKLEEDAARDFLSWIANGKCGNDAFAAKHKELFETIFKWRKGFLQSIVVAHAAAEINPKLTAAELKAISQQVVNGAPSKPLSKAAAKAAQAVIAGGKPLLKAVARKILPALTLLSTAMAAKRGWAGQGHAGDGAWGAFNETMRDLMIADVIEPIVFPAVLHTVDGLTNLLAPGLNAPGRNRYIWRGGKRIDLETGRIID